MLRILLMEDDARNTSSIFGALGTDTDTTFAVQWVGYCADELDELARAAAIGVQAMAFDHSIARRAFA